MAQGAGEQLLHAERLPDDGLRLTIAAGRDALEPARLALLEHLAPTSPPPSLVYALELVLEEVLMNLAWHAWPDGGIHSARVTLAQQPDAVVLTFEDDGIPFNPLEAATPPPAADLAHARVGGLGLALVRRFGRELAYERVDGLNRLRVTLAKR
jgi:anti-sigma regulatory factor (Ser/Thr protein kinase)